VITINAVPLPPACSNSIKRYSHLWYAIRNDCIFDSNRSGYSLMVQRISPRIRSQGWLQMTIHCMLEIRRCYMCNYIIPRQ
jgi:hypothetical protein